LFSFLLDKILANNSVVHAAPFNHLSPAIAYCHFARAAWVSGKQISLPKFIRSDSQVAQFNGANELSAA
jgi:hypothetical protein